jgi:hypothetical protein
MRHIEILISDGFIGNKALLIALSSLTTGNLNSKLKQNVQPYTIKDVLPSMHDYIIVPPTEEEIKDQANQQLLSFLSMRPGGLKHLGLEDV